MIWSIFWVTLVPKMLDWRVLGLKVLMCSTKSFCLGSRSLFQPSWTVSTHSVSGLQLVEKQIGHLLIEMLARMHDLFIVMLPQNPGEGEELDELRTGADDGEDVGHWKKCLNA